MSVYIVLSKYREHFLIDFSSRLHGNEIAPNPMESLFLKMG